MSAGVPNLHRYIDRLYDNPSYRSNQVGKDIISKKLARRPIGRKPAFIGLKARCHGIHRRNPRGSPRAQRWYQIRYRPGALTVRNCLSATQNRTRNLSNFPKNSVNYGGQQHMSMRLFLVFPIFGDSFLPSTLPIYGDLH